MADTATAASTAAATKKKYRNKNKKSQQQQQKTVAETAQGAAASKTAAATVAHQPNGHVQGAGDATDDADVALINGIMQQVQLCNGHAQVKAKAKVSKAESVAETSRPTVATTLNGHVNKCAAIHNNNHINNDNNSNNNNNNVNNKTSSRNKNNNNNSSNSSGSGKVKNNNKSKSAVEACTLRMLVPVSDPSENQEEGEVEEEQRTTSVKGASVVATSKSTANTQTTSATTTKTTAMAIATRGSSQDEAPSTSAAAAAAAAQSQPTQQQHQSQPQQQPQESLQLQLEPAISADEIIYKEYEAEHQMHDIMRLIQAELSEPYSIYTYRYFIYNWPKLCFLASHDNQYVGAIVCKLDMHMNVRRGYIAMLAVRKEYRKLKIGTTLVTKAIEAMLADNADEVVLETEMRNEPALRLYENLGFVRDKRLFRYYLNGVDALRLKLWFR